MGTGRGASEKAVGAEKRPACGRTNLQQRLALHAWDASACFAMRPLAKVVNDG